jgi:hypothetical protein
MELSDLGLECVSVVLPESIKVLVDLEAMLESVHDVIDTVSECGE